MKAPKNYSRSRHQATIRHRAFACARMLPSSFYQWKARGDLATPLTLFKPRGFWNSRGASMKRFEHGGTGGKHSSWFRHQAKGW